jgi:hypothetical protein
MQAAQAVQECIKLRLVKADDFNLSGFSELFIVQVKLWKLMLSMQVTKNTRGGLP